MEISFFPPLYSYNCPNCSLMCKIALWNLVSFIYLKFIDKTVLKFSDEIWYISLYFVKIWPHWKMLHMKSVNLYVVIIYHSLVSILTRLLAGQ
jgi:hypothetical protein